MCSSLLIYSIHFNNSLNLFFFSKALTNMDAFVNVYVHRGVLYQLLHHNKCFITWLCISTAKIYIITVACSDTAECHHSLLVVVY